MSVTNQSTVTFTQDDRNFFQVSVSRRTGYNESHYCIWRRRRRQEEETWYWVLWKRNSRVHGFVTTNIEQSKQSLINALRRASIDIDTLVEEDYISLQNKEWIYEEKEDITPRQLYFSLMGHDEYLFDDQPIYLGDGVYLTSSGKLIDNL